MLWNENVQIRAWILGIILAVYCLEAFISVWILGAISTLSGIVYVVCVMIQSVALGLAMLWRLNNQAVLMDLGPGP